MMPTSLIEIANNRVPVEQLLAGLLDKDMGTSLKAGQRLVQRAKEAELTLPDYLMLAVDTNQGEMKGGKLNGYEAALAYLNLPIRNDFQHGVVLQAAAETFQTFPGTRSLFPAVIDNILQWNYRQDQIENVGAFIGNSRNIAGNEMITTVITDSADNYQVVGVIPEGARIPIRSLRASEKGVKIYKFGGGYEFTYEFERRVSLDVVTPYAARMQREVEIGRSAMATALLVNGDGVSGAAPVVTATTLASQFAGAPSVVAGTLQWEIFLRWLINQAKAGVPIDTVVGNWDLYFQWIRMFATPTANLGPSQIEILARAGVQTAIENPRFNFNVNFALSSTAPAAKLIGLIKNETIEELVENGSDIEESVRAVENQKVRYVKTTNRGYRLVFGDTRTVLNLV